MSRTYIIANYFCKRLDEYAFACKNLYNSTLYEYRQMFFNGEGIISAYDMFDVMSTYDSPIPAKVYSCKSKTAGNYAGCQKY